MLVAVREFHGLTTTMGFVWSSRTETLCGKTGLEILKRSVFSVLALSRDDSPAVFHCHRSIFAEFVLVVIDFSFPHISLPRSSVDLEFDERGEVSPTMLWAIHSVFSTDQYEFHSFGFDSAYREPDYSSLEMKKSTLGIRSTKVGLFTRFLFDRSVQIWIMHEHVFTFIQLLDLFMQLFDVQFQHGHLA